MALQPVLQEKELVTAKPPLKLATCSTIIPQSQDTWSHTGKADVSTHSVAPTLAQPRNKIPPISPLPCLPPIKSYWVSLQNVTIQMDIFTLYFSSKICLYLLQFTFCTQFFRWVFIDSSFTFASYFLLLFNSLLPEGPLLHPFPGGFSLYYE